VIALAEELFAERGFGGASMEELARRAGVSKPVIYDLVRSKDELYRRCFERAADELAASVATAIAAAGRDVEPQLRAGALAFFDFIASHRAAWAMLFADDAGGREARHLAHIRARQASTAAAALRAQAERNGVRLDGAALEAAAWGLNGAYEALAMWWREHPEVSAAQLADWVVALALPGVERLVGARG